MAWRIVSAQVCLLFCAQNSRHTTAMQLLQSGVDRSVIALWLGHESLETTQGYLAADMAMKERALAKTAPPRSRTGRFKPGDRLLAFLSGCSWTRDTGGLGAW